MNTIVYFHTLQSVHLPFPTSLLSYHFKKQKKKQQEQVTKKFSKEKQAHVGMEPFWEVDILGVDISGVDILGVDILGVDILGRTRFN